MFLHPASIGWSKVHLTIGAKKKGGDNNVCFTSWSSVALISASTSKAPAVECGRGAGVGLAGCALEGRRGSMQ